MANEYKVTMIFAAGGNGWTESLYYRPPSPLPLTSDMTSLVKLRLALLASNAQMLSMRVAEVAEPNRSFLYGADVGTGPGTLSTASNSVPWFGLQVGLQSSSNVYSRNFSIRGIPKAIWGWNALQPHTLGNLGVFKAPLDNYLTLLSNGVPVGIREFAGTMLGLSRSRDQVQRQLTKIAAINAAEKGDRWQVTADAFSPLAVGDAIAITRVRGEGTKGANGSGIVTNVITAGTVYVVNRTKADGSAVQYAKTGYYFKIVPAFWGPTDANAVEWVKHDEGRPIGPTRGRRRAAV